MEERKVFNIPLVESEIDEVILALKYCDKLSDKELKYLINRFLTEMERQKNKVN